VLRRTSTAAALATAATLLTALPASAEPAYTAFTVDRLADVSPGVQTYDTPAVTLLDSPAGGLRLAAPYVTLTVAPPAGGTFAGSFPVGATQTAEQGALAVTSTCGLTGAVTVLGATYDGTTLTTLTASYDAACASAPETRYAGVIRYASPDGWVETTTAIAGDQQAGVAYPRPFDVLVNNAGTIETTPGTPSFAGTYAAEYAVSHDGCAGLTLQPQQTCTVTVTFAPAALGSRPATLAIPTPGHPRAGGTVVALHGYAVPPPDAPAGLDWYESTGGTGLTWPRVDAPQVALSYVLYRRATAQDAWAAVATPAGPSAVDAGLAPGATAQYAVAAVGTGGEGPKTAPLTVTRPATAPAAGTGDALVVDDDLPTMTSVRLDGAVGDTVAYQPDLRWLTASGGDRTANVTVPVVRPGTYQAVAFPATPGPGERTVRVTVDGSTCELVGTLDVTEAAYDGDRHPQVLAFGLSGTCANSDLPVHLDVRWHSGTPYVLTAATPAQLAVAKPVGAAADRVVTLTSRGSGPATPGTPVIDGTGAADWQVAANGCTAPLARDAACTLTVRFAPSATGARDAVLHLPDGGRRGARTVTLSGVGGAVPTAVTLRRTPTLAGTGLFWVTPDGNGLPLTGYHVYRRLGTGAWTLLGSPAADATSYLDTTAAYGTAYGYAVAAVNEAGEGPLAAYTATRTHAQVVVTAGDPWTTVHGLYLTSPAGGDGVPLEVDGHDHTTPAVSPDGTQVVYARADDGGQYDLWVRRTDGSGTARRLTFAAGDDTDPAWSPDGLRIAYVNTWTSTLRTVAASGGGSTQRGIDLTEPAWLPDNTTLVVRDLLSGTNGRLVLLGPTGARTPVAHTEGGRTPVVSPDGAWVAFQHWDGAHGKVGAARLDGSGSTGWLDRPGDDLWAPDWRRDGKALYVQHNAGITVSLATAPFAGGAFGGLTDAAQFLGNWVFQPAYDALGVRFTSTPALTTAAARLPFATTGSPAGTTYTCALDGGTAKTCASPWSGTVPSGRHTLVVTSKVPGELATVAAHRWLADASRPLVSMGAVPPVRLEAAQNYIWTGGDTWSGVASYDARWHRASATTGFGAYAYPASWQRRTTTSVALPLSPGYEVCVSVRARDRAGNVSAWSPDRCTARPLDDTALAVTNAWGRATTTSGSWYLGTYTGTATSGATLSKGGVTARRITLVVATCSWCGSITVYLGGSLVGTVSTRSSPYLYRQQLTLTLPAARTGTLVLRASGGTVNLDGLATRRT
jgi:hypothetical protein